MTQFISVDLVARLLPETAQEPLLWKWIIIAAHNGLQGAMVCALSHTDGTGALTKKSATKLQDWFEKQEGPHPEPWMAHFPSLLARACDETMVPHGPALDLNDGELKDIDRLNLLRRDFAHFTPKGWSIETEGLPRIILTAVAAIEHLMLQNGWIVSHLGDERQQHLASALRSIREGLV